MDEIRVTVTEEWADTRLDVYMAKTMDISRSFAQQLVETGDVLVNGKAAKSNRRLSEGDEVAVTMEQPAELQAVPEDIPLNVVYEDKDIIVVNKARGMVVHPAAGNPNGTLVNALLYHCRGELSGINGVIRPGIVHRLDKDTSGVMVAAKTTKLIRDWPRRSKPIRPAVPIGPSSTATLPKKRASSTGPSAAIPRTESRWPSPLRAAAKP